MPTLPQHPYKIGQRVREALERRSKYGRLLVSGAAARETMIRERQKEIAAAKEAMKQARRAGIIATAMHRLSGKAAA